MPSSRCTTPSTPYNLTDPTPSKSKSTPTKTYTHTGRGGAGNVIRVPPPSALSNTPSTPRPSQSRTGSGGAGNIHRVPSEHRMFSFDEELALQLARSSNPAPIYHVGRGGAGNTARLTQQERERVYNDGGSRRRESDSSSGGSEKSEPRNIPLWSKIGRTVGRTGDYFVG